MIVFSVRGMMTCSLQRFSLRVLQLAVHGTYMAFTVSNRQPSVIYQQVDGRHTSSVDHFDNLIKNHKSSL